jgi:hypothetical protein
MQADGRFFPLPRIANAGKALPQCSRKDLSIPT